MRVHSTRLPAYGQRRPYLCLRCLWPYTGGENHSCNISDGGDLTPQGDHPVRFQTKQA